MRLATAAFILVQALPASGRDADPSLVLDVLSQTKSSSSRRDVPQFRRFGRNRRAARRALDQAKDSNNVEMIPTGNECNPDVGLLSCGFGSYCTPDKDSTTGGTCTPLVRNARKSNARIAAPAIGFYYCEQSASDDDWWVANDDWDQTENDDWATADDDDWGGDDDWNDDDWTGGWSPSCDCSGWDPYTATGNVSCTIYSNYCLYYCSDSCLDFTLNYSTDGTEWQYTSCQEFHSPYEQQFCFQMYGDLSCTLTLDGTQCTSCERLTYSYCVDFDCGNVGLSSGNACYDYLYAPIVEQCYSPYTCFLCPSGDVAFPNATAYVPGFGDIQCSAAAAFAEAFGNEDTCALLSDQTKDSCCAQPFVCNLCGTEGWEIMEPDGEVNFWDGTSANCSDLESMSQNGEINQELCALIAPKYTKDVCGCADTTGSTPPTVGPTALPTIANVTEAPTGASVAAVSYSSSLVGGAAVLGLTLTLLASAM
eukprot:Nitzschia sp. Nitz4//scaffold16_size188269//186247//187773//NITZ4_001823-RA/size188269-augustus-gene-0.85-mRNA-1//1//CDS//3329538613//8002//frame0